MRDLIIGNMMSMVCAIFTMAANWTNSKSKSYIYQFWQCAILAVANVFFHSYAGITTLVLCALRNLLIGKEKYTKKLCVVFMIAIGVVGLLVNNKGIPGIILVLATVGYTWGSYVVMRPMAVKANILINQACWAIYEIFVLDIVSLITEIITMTVLIISMIRLRMQHDRSHS